MTAMKKIRHCEDAAIHNCHCEARSAVAIQGGGCMVTVVAMAMALWIATPFGLAMTAKGWIATSLRLSR